MRGELPSGVVTFLFTDIEGSTRLLHDLGEGYADALLEHRRLLRESFAAYDGVEVDTQGDAFFVAFGRATDAVAAAEASQRALAAGPVRVRVGLHTGEPSVTDEGYVGLDVHKGARIAAVGHGGQVLLSQTTRALVDFVVRDLGAHRLKDISAPERIYQLEIDGLPNDFPLLKTLEAGIKNLPVPRTSFVGRTEELDAIDRLLASPDCRLLTLVGPGGAGKTRLALEAAARRVDLYPHGVHFVPLASVPSPDFLAPALAESIQFAVDTAHSGVAAHEQLLDYLSERATLLVLDNFEHLVEGAGLLGDVIERAPAVELITTSRERLNVQSEWVVDVVGLGTAENGGSGGALRLFVDRATQVEPGFELDGETEHAHRICRLVDGMPLAIELAASWVPVLSCAEIADEIEGNIDFLATSMRDVPERHRSLRAAIDQSWRLLTDEQRRVFARLSTFRGSFDRTAAAAVAEADVRVVSELVAKSLVRRPEYGRFELHELLRQYAADRLAAEPQDAAAVYERHARHYAAEVLAREEALLGPTIATARDELRRDVDNLRQAAEWLVEHAEPCDARAVLVALHTFFWVHSPFDGAETFERLARATGFREDDQDPGRASDLALSAATIWLAFRTDLGYEPAVEELASQLLPHLRDRGLERELGACLLMLGIIAVYVDIYPDAVAYLREAIEVSHAGGDGLAECAALSWLGFAELLLEELDAARTTFEECLAVAKRLGSPLLEAYATSKLGVHADAEERFADAMRMHMEANALFDSVGDRGGAGYTLSRASMSAFGLGDHAEALRLGRAGYEAFSDVNNRWGMIAALCRIGFPALELGDSAEASRCFHDALARAQATTAVSLELLALSGIGALVAARGDDERAATILIFALGHEQLPAAYGFPARPVLARLERELGAEELAAARDSAAGTDLEELVRVTLAEAAVA